MNEHFEQFIRERQYLKDVSHRTIDWYKESFRWLARPDPDEAYLKLFVIRMREAGLKASSCNNRIRCINAYLKWKGSSLKVSKLKEEHRVLPTFTPDDIQKFLKWKPKGFCRFRLQVLILLLADTGCRVDEALSLRWDNVDFDNLLLTVLGKGNKERKVPFSFELRRVLFRYQKAKVCDLVFPTRTGLKLTRRHMLRAVKELCQQLGIKIPERTLHAFRHYAEFRTMPNAA